MCNTMPERIAHVVSGCTTLAATSYLKRHNSVAKIIHLEVANKFNLVEVKEPFKWYNYTPEKVLENESSKLLWDFQINTVTTALLFYLFVNIFLVPSLLEGASNFCEGAKDMVESTHAAGYLAHYSLVLKS